MTKLGRTYYEKHFFNPRYSLRRAHIFLELIKEVDSGNWEHGKFVKNPNFNPNDKKYDDMLIERKRVQEEYIKFKNIHSDYIGVTTSKSRSLN